MKISDITMFVVYRSGDEWVAAVDYALISDDGHVVSNMKSVPVIPITPPDIEAIRKHIEEIEGI